MPARSLKILIVDDEPHIRTLLKATLFRAGYSVVEASTAREAMTAVKNPAAEPMIATTAF